MTLPVNDSVVSDDRNRPSTWPSGFSWEATAFATFVGEGRLESPLHTHEETVSILATIDEARRQLGAR